MYAVAVDNNVLCYTALLITGLVNDIKQQVLPLDHLIDLIVSSFYRQQTAILISYAGKVTK